MQVFLHPSIDHRRGKHRMWSSGPLALAPLGLAVTMGSSPAPGTRLAVVGSAVAFPPHGPAASALLQQLSAASAPVARPRPHAHPASAAAAAAATQGAAGPTTPSRSRSASSHTRIGGSHTSSAGSNVRRTRGQSSPPGAATCAAAPAAAPVPTASAAAAAKAAWSEPGTVRVVREQWLVDCATKRRLLDPAPYDIRNVPPQGGAPAANQAGAAHQQMQQMQTQQQAQQQQAQAQQGADLRAAAGGRLGAQPPSKRARIDNPAPAVPVAPAPAATPAMAQPPPPSPAPAPHHALGSRTALGPHPLSAPAPLLLQLQQQLLLQQLSGARPSRAQQQRHFVQLPPDEANGGQRLDRSAAETARVEQAIRDRLSVTQPVPQRPWVPPRLGSGAPVVVPAAPQPLAWWDPERGVYMAVPDPQGRPRPGQQAVAAAAPARELAAVIAGAGTGGTAAACGGAVAAAAAAVGAAGAATSAGAAAGISGTGGGAGGSSSTAPGVAAPGAPAAVRVVTYNILGDQLDPRLRSWRNWAYRRPRLWEEIVAYGADVVCLQEVVLREYRGYFRPHAHAAGYGTLFLPRGGRMLLDTGGLRAAAGCVTGACDPHPDLDRRDGVVLLYRRSRLRLLAAGGALLRDWAPGVEEQAEFEAEHVWELARIGVVGLLAVLQVRADDGDGEDAGAVAAAADTRPAGAAVATDAHREGGAGGGESSPHAAAAAAIVEDLAGDYGCNPGECSGGGYDSGAESDGVDAAAARGVTFADVPTSALLRRFAGGNAVEDEVAPADELRLRNVCGGRMPVGDVLLGHRYEALARELGGYGNVPSSSSSGGGDAMQGVRRVTAAVAEGACVAAAAAGGGVFCVATTHLWFDPELPDVKIAEAHLLCRAARTFMGQLGCDDPLALPLLLCGDLNSCWARFRGDAHDTVAAGGCSVSGVYELLSSGSLSAEHHHHPLRVGRRTGDRRQLQRLTFDTSGLRLASTYMVANGREVPVTIRSWRGFRGVLDYVFASRGHWAVARTLDVPYSYHPDPRTDDLDRRLNDARRQRQPRMLQTGTPLVDTSRDADRPPYDNDAECGSSSSSEGEVARAMAAARPGMVLGAAAVSRECVWDMRPIPNAQWPSDHLAMGADLLLLPPALRERCG